MGKLTKKDLQDIVPTITAIYLLIWLVISFLVVWVSSSFFSFPGYTLTATSQQKLCVNNSGSFKAIKWFSWLDCILPLFIFKHWHCHDCLTVLFLFKASSHQRDKSQITSLKLVENICSLKKVYYTTWIGGRSRIFWKGGSVDIVTDLETSKTKYKSMLILGKKGRQRHQNFAPGDQCLLRDFK